MVLICDYSLDIGYTFFSRVVAKTDKPLVDGIAYPEIDSLLPSELLSLFREVRRGCPEFKGVRHRRLRFQHSQAEYTVTLPIPASSAQFIPIRDHFLTTISVTQFELLEEKIPNHLLKLILPRI